MSACNAAQSNQEITASGIGALGQLAQQQSRTAHVSCGSQPDLPPVDRHVCFAALNGLKSNIAPRPKSTNPEVTNLSKKWRRLRLTRASLPFVTRSRQAPDVLAK
jgi:hypothetical protein